MELIEYFKLSVAIILCLLNLSDLHIKSKILGINVSIGSVKALDNDIFVYQFPCIKPLIKIKIAK